MGGETPALFMGLTSIAFAIGCFVYCYRKNVLALLPIAVVLMVAGSLNLVVASLHAQHKAPGQEKPNGR